MLVSSKVSYVFPLNTTTKTRKNKYKSVCVYNRSAGPRIKKL